VSSTQRQQRLAAELDVMRALAKQSSILEFEPQGDPPDRYTITLRGRGVKRGASYGAGVEYVDHHKCEVRLGYDFPRQPPEVRWLTPIFHPNISYSGYVELKDCGLMWAEDLSLDVVCERIWDLARLAWFDLDKARDHSAKKWVSEQGEVGLPVDAQDGVPAFVSGRFPADVRDVHPGRVGPGEGVDLVERGPGQRVAHGLAVAEPLAGNAERGHRRGPRRQLDGRSGVAGKDPAEVVAEPAAQPLVVQLQYAFGLVPELDRRPAPGRHPVRLLVGKGGEHSFP